MDLYESLCELVRSKIPITLKLANGITSEVVITGANRGFLGEVTGTAQELSSVKLVEASKEAKIDPGPGYRLLEEGEKVQEGDDRTWNGKWEPSVAWMPGNSCEGSQIPANMPYRRKIRTDLKTFAARTPLDMEELHKSLTQFPPPQVSTDSRLLVESSHKNFLNWIADRLVHVHNDPEGVDFVRHLRDIASKLLESPLKPFTPNKYTRYIPTLDGRKVPVDVYCVLAAFPTGASAVDHAVKKLLAPGQRGHKDRIQDLKEARDSLNRAIELEEAVDG